MSKGIEYECCICLRKFNDPSLVDVALCLNCKRDRLEDGGDPFRRGFQTEDGYRLKYDDGRWISVSAESAYESDMVFQADEYGHPVGELNNNEPLVGRYFDLCAECGTDPDGAETCPECGAAMNAIDNPFFGQDS